ncbi:MULTISPECIES: hypothetical protein [Sphingomonadaceae]|uniref:hypothetical protein n=1 Tax=Sphingomonadales TaxID=204457 RepID=UPI000F5E3E27|nr:MULTISPECIES: hypothetical protein [Sphingomonadaceae]MBU0657912.1 hypothetical protein [Alphaproteobacteria bacterium]MBU0868563.1 hypothetical protein [Alphaproteobacteria bacterium]MBU1463206.1 hypothetical protein [Alphaproteobacteria bacterium]MCC4258550.1 hypothetical protein [Sphingobium lactosutens]QWT16560.1 hypothetical protein GTV57_20470 [Sphingobium xenophagum]
MKAHRIGKTVASWNVTTRAGTAAARRSRETIPTGRRALASARVRPPLPTFLVGRYNINAMVLAAYAQMLPHLSIPTMDRQIDHRRNRGDIIQ